MTKRRKLKILSLTLSFAILFSLTGGNTLRAESESDNKAKEDIEEQGEYERYSSYEKYLSNYEDAKTPDDEIVIKGSDYSDSYDANLEVHDELKGKENILEWTKETGWVEWEVDVKEAGLYNLAMSYYPLEGKGREIEFEMEINGEIPFEGAIKLQFNRVWRDETDIQIDNRGNELRPRQVEAPMWLERDFKDTEGLYNDPYKIYLEEGKNTIRLISIREPVAIEHLKLYQKKELPLYEEIKKEYEDKGYEAAESNEIVLQAENPYVKSHSVLHPISDKSSPATIPYHPIKIRMNTIGGTNWRYPSQWITWKFEVEEAGLYKIGMRYRQNAIRGFFTTRSVSIDGKIPFEELEQVKFPYGINWQKKILGDENPYEFYFDEGEHEITMEVSLGEMAKTLRIVQDSVYRLNEMYRQIIMITSVQPDLYRDYFLNREIPGLIDTFTQVSKTLSDEANRIEEVTGQKGTEAVLLLRVAEQLESMVEKPDTIPERLTKYKDNISALAAWILSIKEQPIELDYIEVLPTDKEMGKVTANVFERIWHEIRAFAGSFFEDYTSVGNTFDEKESINVWIATGRDQAQVLKNMIDDRFTPQTGITVNLSLVQGALLQATMAGKGPDVALTVGRGEPVNLALRGAVVPLDQFEEFDDITKRFMPTAMLPYELDGHTYALPETQTFFMMFYRKDVFDELEIKPPDTWDDLYEIAPVIQRNNMQIGLPYVLLDAYSLIGMGMGAQSIFPTLIKQNGGDIYNDEYTKTQFDTPLAYRAFKQWTDFYSLYSFPLFKDDYSRFRTGEMPITITAYTFYNMLSVAAPEIKNLWEMIPIPGVEKEDGSVDKTSCAAGAGSIIIGTTKKKEASWEFMKWWSEADTQGRFGNEVEALMGPAGRYTPANVEAFSQIPWSYKERDILMEQWEKVSEIPEVPGGYYTQRNLDNAFRAVIFRYENARESLNYWNNETNDEIMRKRIEFGLSEE